MKIKGNKLFQYSTISALMGKDLYGSITFKQLLKHGNFGLGTFHAADGELIILDNKAYQMLDSSQIKKVNNNMTSPFASLTKFQSNQELNFNNISYQELEKVIVKSFPSLNIFYAIKITGTFDEINIRTVTKQSEPFPSLQLAAKTQKQLTFHNVKGTIVMFWTPSFARTIAVAGFHGHFISEDKKQGGHIFNFNANHIKVEICYLTDLILKLPTSQSYLQYQVEESTLQDDIKKVESFH